MKIRRITKSAWKLSAALLLLVTGLPVFAGEPTVLVTDVSPSRTDVLLMDMLEPGHVIKLAVGEKLVLGYLTSCREETITGAKVTVGKVKSMIEGGVVEVQVVACDSEQVAATGNEAGAVVFRAAPMSKKLPKPDKTLYSPYPFLKTDPAIKSAVLTRLDRKERARTIRLTNGIADLKDIKARLVRKALYKISAGTREKVFLIHAGAKSSEKALLSRFVIF